MKKLTPNQLALYLGSKCMIFSDLTERWRNDILDIALLDAHVRNTNGAFTKIIPKLRPLSSMTYQEFADLFNDECGLSDEFSERSIKRISSSLLNLHELISQKGKFDTIPTMLTMGFDLFNWINDEYAFSVYDKYDQYLKKK